jgi:2-polyprenyl-6-methoxyphenol hydroxylase-like FAD-dependent oxidoreductase
MLTGIMKIDFLIAGGGIGGAVLANLLGRQGKQVLVLEKEIAPMPLVRPEVLWPTTVERLRALIPREFDDEWQLPVDGIVISRRGTILLDSSRAFLERAGVQPISSDPGRTRERMLQSGQFELRRGVEVIDVLKDRRRVVGVRVRSLGTGVEQDLLAHWTIGDDGVHSPIRRGCGIQLRTKELPVDLLCFGFGWPESLDARKGRAWLNVADGILACAAIPLPGGKGAGLIAARPRAIDHPERSQRAWKEFFANDPTIAAITAGHEFPGGFVRVRRPWGHAQCYGVEGAMLIGDALHPVSPAGGQGANMSVADATAVAELLSDGETDIVARYERRRRAANERSLGITRTAARAMLLPDWLIRWALPIAFNQVSRRPELATRFLRSVSTAFME